MKNLKINLLVVLFAFFGLNAAIAQECDPAACAETKAKTTSTQMMEGAKAQFVSNTSEVKTANITFAKDKLIEVAIISIKAGKENQMNGDYFPKVMPVAIPYGAKPIGSFAITRRVVGESPGQVVVFFEWTSVEQKRAFEQDPKYLELRNIRNDALEFLTQGYFSVDQDITIEVADNKVYDFAALWVNPDNAPLLQEYFGAVMPEATKPKIGYTPLATLTNAGYHDMSYHPSVIAFAEWKGGSEAVDKLEKTKAFKHNVHKREKAAPYKDVFHLKPIL